MDARLALDKSRGDLHDDSLNGISRTPALLSQKFHANGAPEEDISTGDDRIHNTHKWRIKGIRFLKKMTDLKIHEF